MAQGQHQPPPGPLMSSGRSDDKKWGGFVLDSNNTNATRVTEPVGPKVPDVLQAPELGRQPTDLQVVNIVHLAGQQFLVELEDGSEYRGALKNSLFNGYGELENRSIHRQ